MTRPKPKQTKMNRENRNNSDDIERRYITHEVRADGEGETRTIAGTASSFASLYDMGWFLEQVAPGVIDESTDTADCKCLFNHDTNIVLGSTSGSQLELTSDASGLYYRNKNVDTTAARDVYELIRSGAVNKSSFAFSVSKQKWEIVDRATLKGKIPEEVLDRVSYGGEVEIRTIEKIKKLWDVSPVTFPANSNTSTEVAKRSRDMSLGERKQEAKDQTKDQTKQKTNTLLGIDADLRLREIETQL